MSIVCEDQNKHHVICLVFAKGSNLKDEFFDQPYPSQLQISVILKIRKTLTLQCFLQSVEKG